MPVAIRIENVSKLYRLGTVGTGTISHDLNRWWHQIRGKEDPYAKVGQINDRTRKSGKPSVASGQLSANSATENCELPTDNSADGGPANCQLPTDNSRASGPDYVWALHDINLEVQQGEILGIIGRNGAGKSTLLKLLSRVTAPTSGSIKTKGRIASLLEVGTGFHPELTGRENIYLNGAILGMKRHEITNQLDAIVEFSGCAKYLDTPVKRYSSGMMVRLGFAVAAHLECEILIVDEVLAVGDLEFQRKCTGKMQSLARNEGRTVLFVSHNLQSVRSLCTTVAEMASGTVSRSGNTDEIVSDYISGLSSACSVWKRDPMPQADGASVISSSVMTESGLKTAVYATGETICIEIQIQCCDSMTPLDFGISINEATSGARVVGDSTNTQNTWQTNPSGLATITYKAKTPSLNPGKYLVTVAMESRGLAIDFLEDILEFEVQPAPGHPNAKFPLRNFGLVLVEGSWSYESVHPSF